MELEEVRQQAGNASFEMTTLMLLRMHETKPSMIGSMCGEDELLAVFGAC